MTRQEQIEQAAYNEFGRTDAVVASAKRCWIEGAQWSDKNPDIIPWDKTEYERQTEREIAKYKSACDVMMKALEQIANSEVPGHSYWSTTLTAVAEAKKIMGGT